VGENGDIMKKKKTRNKSEQKVDGKGGKKSEGPFCAYFTPTEKLEGCRGRGPNHPSSRMGTRGGQGFVHIPQKGSRNQPLSYHDQLQGDTLVGGSQSIGGKPTRGGHDGRVGENSEPKMLRRNRPAAGGTRPMRLPNERI